MNQENHGSDNNVRLLSESFYPLLFYKGTPIWFARKDNSNQKISAKANQDVIKSPPAKAGGNSNNTYLVASNINYELS